MKDAYYFSHDRNARDDPKNLEMRSVYGSIGYGWFWILVELMSEQEGYKLGISSKYAYHGFASQMQCNPTEAEKFISDCILEFKLFETDSEFFWSNTLLRRMGKAHEKSEKARKSAESRWQKKEENANASENDANASKIDAIKESKEKERKEKEMKLKKDIDIRSVYEHWKSKSILINHRKLEVHIQNQINYKLNDYTVDELKECIHHYSVILADPEYKLDTKWSLHDFLEKNHYEKFLTERDPYTFYPKIGNFITPAKKSKFDKNKDLLLKGRDTYDGGSSEIYSVQGIGSLPEPN